MPEQRPSGSDPADAGEAGPHRLTRRQFLPRATGAAAALVAAGAAGYGIRESERESVAVHNPYADLSSRAEQANARLGPAPGAPGSGIQRFVTRPDLLPPYVTLNTLGVDDAAAHPRFLLVTPMTDVDFKGLQRGPMLIDRRGRLVWFQPNRRSVFDANVQSYQGKPVLTWWQGKFAENGLGVGTAVIVDHNYRTIASVPSRPGLPIDIHEFLITPRGTALLTSYPKQRVDLRALGGPTAAEVFAGRALEVDIATGKVLFDWNSLDHVPVTESYEPLPDHGKPYDYFHINSIAETPDGQLLISGRHTSTIYKVNRRTGQVIWRLGGKRSDFRIEPAARFSYQHDARMHASGSDLTLFDNANQSGHNTQGLHLTVDTSQRQVKLKRSYRYPAKFYAQAMGNTQVLPSGEVFIGWGWQRYFSQFDADGHLLLSAQFDAAMRTYRAFAVDWVGHPSEAPVAVSTKSPEGGTLVYASWNGATEIDHWTVLAGPTLDALEAVGWQPWCGFETAIVVNSNAPIFVAVAEDRSGTELGRSKVA